VDADMITAAMSAMKTAVAANYFYPAILSLFGRFK
jgi:hypothetical protein